MSKQNFQVGSVVSVGFVRGLRVIAKIPTPGDFAPDAYVLQQEANGRWYRFVPHNGLFRCESQVDAEAA